jgi:hypothetical protein
LDISLNRLAQYLVENIRIVLTLIRPDGFVKPFISPQIVMKQRGLPGKTRTRSRGEMLPGRGNRGDVEHTSRIEPGANNPSQISYFLPYSVREEIEASDKFPWYT